MSRSSSGSGRSMAAAPTGRTASTSGRTSCSASRIRLHGGGVDCDGARAPTAWNGRHRSAAHRGAGRALQRQVRAGSRPSGGRQPLEQSADWRHLPCARLLLLGQRCPGQKSPRVTGQPFLRHDVRARRSLARRRARGAGGRSRRTRAAGPRPRPALSRSSRGLWTRCGVCAAGAMPPPPAAGFGLLPTRASLACHGSSAIRCWNRFAAIASTSSSSPTCAAGATPHSPPIIVEGRHRHRRQE